MKTQLTKNEQAMYPKTFKVTLFKHGSDTRDRVNESYAYEVITKDRREESRFYEGLNHEATLTIQTKLSNGVIK